MGHVNRLASARPHKSADRFQDAGEPRFATEPPGTARIMRKVVVTEAGDPQVLELQQAPDPKPGPEEALVRLEAANVNPTDLGARQGTMPGC